MNICNTAINYNLCVNNDVYRSKYYLFEEYLGQWFERLKHETPTSVTVWLQKEINKFKVGHSNLKI